ncbi:MAG: hypothetical protein NC432_08075 [Roseburia sp.]|nr:hypothetical protein [Roseburia sp.]MCM1099102.1 hypothetical protein [Ruminococcus flavefaciens]
MIGFSENTGWENVLLITAFRKMCFQKAFSGENKFILKIIRRQGFSDPERRIVKKHGKDNDKGTAK